MMADFIEKEGNVDYIFFFDRRTNNYVVDMRVIYDCDNELLPDLYAKGLVEEPMFVDFDDHAIFETIKPGLVVVREDSLIKYEKYLRCTLADEDYIYRILKDSSRDFLWLYHEIMQVETVYDIFMELYPQEKMTEVILPDKPHNESSWEPIFRDFLHTFLARSEEF